MWKKYATPLRIRFKVSQRLTVLVWLAHLLAVVTVSMLPIALIWQFIAWGSIVLSLCFSGFNGWKNNSTELVNELVWAGGDQWTLLTKGGTSIEARMSPYWYAQHYLVILHFSCCIGSNRVFLLARDSIGEDEFRRLRVRLRIETATVKKNLKENHW